MLSKRIEPDESRVVLFFATVKDLLAHAGLKMAATLMRMMPFALITPVSNTFAFVLRHMVRYRRAVALQNLQRCFPDQTPSQVRQLLPGIYRNITDVFFETIKAFSARHAGVLPYVEAPDHKSLAQYKGAFRGAILVTAHLSNWEWCGFMLTRFLPGPGIAVYRPLKSKKTDVLMHGHRENSGMQIVPMRNIVRLLSGGAAGTHFVLLIADQSPDPDSAHWVDFFNIKTAFVKGPAILAQRYDLPVFFVHLERTQRHHYRMRLDPLCLQPKTMSPEELTTAYAHKLEQLIRQSPACWLWTHRRWKHKPPPHLHD